MKPSDFQKTVQCRFESCLKKVVRHVVKDYQKKLKRRQKEETLFCELPEIVVENLAVWDDYDTDSACLVGSEMCIRDRSGTTMIRTIRFSMYAVMIFVSMMMNWQKP